MFLVKFHIIFLSKFKSVTRENPWVASLLK